MNKEQIIQALENANLNAVALPLKIHGFELIDIKPEDGNGTGYFDDLVLKELPFKSDMRDRVHHVGVDELERIVIITPLPYNLGNIVLFQRNKDSDVMVCNKPRELALILNGQISDDVACNVLNHNLVNTLIRVAEAAQSKVG